MIKRFTTKDVERIEKLANENNPYDYNRTIRMWKRKNGELRVTAFEQIYSLRKEIAPEKLKGKTVKALSVISQNIGSSVKYGEWIKNVFTEEFTIERLTPKGCFDSKGFFHKLEGKAVVIL